MKKILIAILGVAALAGCSSYYDYYRGDVRYTQDGTDCIYYADESGRHFSEDVRGMHHGKKIVYRNTFCESLYNKDMGGQTQRNDRQVLMPAAREVSCNSCGYQPVESSYGCNTCEKQSTTVLKRRYVLVSAM